MFDTFGTFKSSLGGASDDEAADFIVHTASITDGKAESWRKASTNISTEAFINAQHDVMLERFAYRVEALKARYPHAEFTRLKPNPNPDVEKQTIRSVERFEAMHVEASKLDLNSFKALDAYFANRS